MSSTKYVVIYNSTFHSIELDDEAGVQLLPGAFGVAERRKVQGRISDEDLVVIDANNIGDDANPSAKAARDEYNRLTAEWEAQKAGSSETKEDASNYDDSANKKSAAKSSSKSN